MSQTKQIQTLDILEAKIKHLWSAMISLNCIKLTNDSELKYLIGGRASELIERVQLCNGFKCSQPVDIYGIIAADQTQGRYVWIYLYYSKYLWKCDSLKHAYELVNKFDEFHKEEEGLNNLRKIQRTRKKTALIN